MAANDRLGAEPDGQGPRAEELRLWYRACDGEPAARAQLAQLVDDVARRGCGRLRLSREETEDLQSRLQSSVWQVMLVGRTTPRTCLRGWLRWRFLAVTKQYFRETKKVRALAALLDDEFDVADAKVASTTAAEQRELLQALSQCLAELPEPQRQAVLLRYGHEQTVAQCRSILASSNANTIRVWIFRGIRQLRACLQGKGILE